MHRDDLADDAHAWQHHDVHRRVRVEPEEVLEEHGIAAHRRIEDADVERAFNHEKRHGDTEHWRREHLNHGRRIDRPQEERHAKPCHAWWAQLVNGHNEVEAREDRREAEDEHADEHWNHAARGKLRAVRRVESPTSIETADKERPHCADRAEHPQIETEEVETRERNVLRSQHDRQNEVTERRRDAWDDHEKHHDRAVKRERLVVVVGAHPLDCARKQQLRPHEQRHDAADEERSEHRGHVHDTDALVVKSEQPRQQASRVREVVVGG